MSKCSFCGGEMPTGKGKMLVLNSGQVKLFCNSKCQGNWSLGRDGKAVKWTSRSRKERGK